MTLPSSTIDLFSDDLLTAPYEAYAQLRAQGPVVHLLQHDLYAVARDAEARQVLDDPATFCSGAGVGLNELINVMGQGTTLMSDGDADDRQRAVIGRPLTPRRALAEVRPAVQTLADDLVDRLVARGVFDAVTDLAEVIPTTWVPDLLGWPTEGRAHLLRWASDNFDALGPDNARCAAAGAGVLEMAGYARDVAARRDLPPESMAAGVLAAAERGDIQPEECPMLLVDYLAPSLDTTVSAIGSAVWLFACNPGQWDRLRREPARVKAAFNEVLRLESPISCFTRLTTADADLGDARVPAGARVLVLFASANRDERRWDRPDTFDIARDSAGHLGFGHGVHACAGMGLARLEGHAVLTALASRVARFELGTPVRKLNNLIRSFASLPVTIHPA